MKTIKLSEKLGKNLITRNDIDRLFSEINSVKTKEITVDFSNIEFISRSSADQYVKMKKSSKKKITDINIPKDVKAMIDLVKHQKTNVHEKSSAATVFLL
jgi:anti-anti-sigma regulatory factor